MKGFRPDPGTPRPTADLAARRAYGELRRRILDGELAQGAVVNEVAMAELLGVSRTPMREAFRELLNEGLLEGNGPRRQVTVRRLSADDLREIRSARDALDPLVAAAAGAAVAGPDSPLVDELRLLAARMLRATRSDDVIALLDVDDEFHAVLARGSGLATVEGILTELRALARLAAVGSGLPSDAPTAVCEAHEGLIAALVGPRRSRSRAVAERLRQCSTALAGEPVVETPGR